MKHLIREIKNNLENKNYLSALALTLTLPDICAKIAYPEYQGNKFNKLRYAKWYNEYIYPYEHNPREKNPFNEWTPDGHAIYKLRCNLLHDGSIDINDDVRREKGIADSINYKFLLTNDINSINLYGEKTNNPSHVLVRISVEDFCRKICAVAEAVYYEKYQDRDIYNDVIMFDFGN